MSFLHIDSALEKAQEHVTANLRENDHTLKEIEAITKEYHKSGQHLKNTGRMIAGKEPIADIKGPGIISKAVTAHFKAERSCLNKLDSSIRKALENIGLSPEQIKEDSSMNRIYNIIQGDDAEDRNDEAEEIFDEETEENTQESVEKSADAEVVSHGIFSGWKILKPLMPNILSKDNFQDDDIER